MRASSLARPHGVEVPRAGVLDDGVPRVPTQRSHQLQKRLLGDGVGSRAFRSPSGDGGRGTVKQTLMRYCLISRCPVIKLLECEPPPPPHG